MWEPEHTQALEAEVGSLAPEVHSEVPGWVRLEKHPGGRMPGRPALARQLRPHQTSAAPTQILPCLRQATVAGLEISGLSEGSHAGVSVGWSVCRVARLGLPSLLCLGSSQ